MTLNTPAQQHPRWLDAAIRLERVPPLAWLALQAAALWPTWLWMARRLGDGSDDPLGLLALTAIALLLWQHRHALRAAPGLHWLFAAGAATLAATLLRGSVAPLVTSLIAMLALAAALLAFLPAPAPGRRGVARLPLLGLAVLALPLIASLQFYAGFPLRVVTAEASRWLLAPLFEVARSGSTLVVDGRLVIVDAPCSGVQMAWLGYFSACAAALWARRADRSFATRLPLVGVLVLAGNVVRNSVLVAFEGIGTPLAPWAHEALGLVLLAAVCGAIWQLMAQPQCARAPSTTTHGSAHHVHAG